MTGNSCTRYEHRCAVCGFDVRLGSVSIALDAAHFRWHQSGGPETESNGFVLCVLHHTTFDLGAFTVREGVLLVSDRANGATGFREALLAYHGKPIRDPQHPIGGRSRSFSTGTAGRSSRARRGIGGRAIRKADSGALPRDERLPLTETVASPRRGPVVGRRCVAWSGHSAMSRAYFSWLSGEP
jgi:hypothetical protein